MDGSIIVCSETIGDFGGSRRGKRKDIETKTFEVNFDALGVLGMGESQSNVLH